MSLLLVPLAKKIKTSDMKKPVKVALISLGSLIAVLAIAIFVVCTFVFSKERLTNLVKGYTAEYVSCQADIESVELTFFSSFPNVAFCVNDLAIINPMEGAQSDTLLGVHRLFAELDVMAFLHDGSINISGFTLKDAQANIYINADTVPNYDVFRTEPSAEEQTDTAGGDFSLDKLSLHNIDIQNLSATFLDHAHQMEARCRNVQLSLDTEANLQDLIGGGDVDLEIGELFYSDSLNYGQLTGLRLKDTHLFYDGKDASVKMPELSVATQEYLLAGETALLAKIWNMGIDDLQVEWRDSLPSLVGVTRLDSSMVTLGKENMMYISTDAVSFDMPLTSTRERWTSAINTQIKSLCFSTDADGALADHLDLSLKMDASTNTAFNDFTVANIETTVGTQRLMGQAHVDMTDTTRLKADVDVSLGATSIADILALVPKAYLSALDGMSLAADLASTHVVANLEVADALDLKNVSVSSQMSRFRYADNTNLSCDIDRLDATVSYPAGTRGKQFSIDGKMDNLAVAMVDDTTNIHVTIPDGQAKILMRDDILNGADPRLDVQFNLADIAVSMDDSLKVEILSPVGSADVDMASVKNCIKIAANANMSGMKLESGAAFKGTTQAIALKLDCLYDDRKPDVLDMVQPVAKLTMSEANFAVDGLPYPVIIPQIVVDFDKDNAKLHTCQLNLGNSRMTLQGTIGQINDWMKSQALLLGDIRLKGSLVDVGQLMDLTSGIGCEEEETVSANAPADNNNGGASPSATEGSSSIPDAATLAEADPFMVPKDVKFVVTTDIETIQMNENSFNNVRGALTIDDGVLVLEEMGFTSKAAKMQLTALYKSPRRNNLFVGWNFHLLDIDIAEMIRLVPEIDTIMPMISSFAGKAEFHLAGETSLFADYSPKMSTLKAVAAIEGKDLTVLDSETFGTIKKYLFKESTTNKIDTMSVELAVARKKMTLYPMLVGWDKYEAVISGTHTIVDAMPFNYHISITKCPLVGGHLGLDINGNLDDVDNISFKLGSCKYANLYRPEKRNITQSQTLELKTLINNSLKRTVKPQAQIIILNLTNET